MAGGVMTTGQTNNNGREPSGIGCGTDIIGMQRSAADRNSPGLLPGATDRRGLRAAAIGSLGAASPPDRSLGIAPVCGRTLSIGSF